MNKDDVQHKEMDIMTISQGKKRQVERIKQIV